MLAYWKSLQVVFKPWRSGKYLLHTSLIKCSCVFIRYKDTHQTFISFVFFFMNDKWVFEHKLWFLNKMRLWVTESWSAAYMCLSCSVFVYLCFISFPCAPMCDERVEGGEDYLPKFKKFMLVATSSSRHIIFLNPESDFCFKVIVSRK